MSTQAESDWPRDAGEYEELLRRYGQQMAEAEEVCAAAVRASELAQQAAEQALDALLSGVDATAAILAAEQARRAADAAEARHRLTLAVMLDTKRQVEAIDAALELSRQSRAN